MKPLLLPALTLFALAPNAAREELAYGLDEDTTLLRTFVADREDSFSRLVWSVDGEEVQETDEIEDETESVERVVVRDEILETNDGVPTDFRRTFVELLQENTRSSGEEEVETTSTSDLEGVTVRYLWDDDDEEFYVEFDDDDEDVDEDLLERLTADLDLARLLPEEEVEEGDSWDIDGQSYLTLMWPSGLVGWYDEDAGEEPTFDYSEEIVSNLEGEGTVTLDEIRFEDDVRIAVLSLELTVETEAELSLSEEEEDAGLERKVEEERTLEGEVLWDLDHGHLYSARVEAELEYSILTTGPAETPDGDEVEVEERFEYEGEIVYTVEVERE